MSTLKVALLQMSACGCDQAAHLAKGEAFCRQAAAMGADLALFPEMWNTGYTSAHPWAPESDLWRHPERWTEEAIQEAATLRLEEVWQGQAIRCDDAFIQRFQALARELNMAIAITYLEDREGRLHNSVSLIDRRGEILLTYAKLHTCAWSADEAALTPGDDFLVCTLETAGGAVQVGAMICFDREFPESARILALKGAEIILTPNACEIEQHRRAEFRTRAYENMVGVALANYAGPRMGHSLAYDPVAFDKQGSRDTLVIEAGESEGVYLATFAMDAIRDYRQREVWGGAFRRPQRYAALAAHDVKEPFVRVSPAGARFDETQQ